MPNQLDSQGSHRWTTRFAVSLSAIIALFGTWGWLTHYGLLPRDFALVAGGVLMAGVCLVAQGVCNNMAVEARRARARGLKWSFRWAALVALGFGAISALGLHHGWQIAEAVAPDLGVTPPPSWLTTTLFVFVAFGEPISFWVVDAVRGDMPNRNAVAEQLGEEPTVTSSKRRRNSWSPRVVEVTKAGLGAAAVATMAVGVSHDAIAQATTPAIEASPTSDAASGPPADNRADQARALAASGWSERRIASRLSVSRHRVRLLLGRR